MVLVFSEDEWQTPNSNQLPDVSVVVSDDETEDKSDDETKNKLPGKNVFLMDRGNF